MLKTLEVIPTSEEEAKIVEVPTQSLEAYEWFSKAHYESTRDLVKINLIIDYYSWAIGFDSTYFDAHSNLGLAYAGRGFPDKAIGEHKEALKIKPKHAEAHANLGAAYYVKGLFDEAISEFQKALGIRPDYPEVHNNLGLAYAGKGLLDDAIREYKEAVRIDPHNASAVGNLACAYEKKKEKQAALAQWRRYLELADNDPKHKQLVPKAKERIRELEGISGESP